MGSLWIPDEGVYTVARVVRGGQWEQDMRHGSGYAGGRMHGVGSLTWQLQPAEEGGRREEHVYRGRFADDKRAGAGCMYLMVDNVDGLRTAQNVYVGMWEEGKRHGAGKLVYSKRQIEGGKLQYPKDPMYVEYMFDEDEGKGGSEVKIPEGSRLLDLVADMKDMKLGDSELMELADAILQPQ
eukprot:gene22277-25550_t